MSLQLLAQSVVVAIILAAVVAPGAEASHLSDPTRCTCSASLGFSKPDLQFVDGVLTFIPRLDYSVRARGGEKAPLLSVAVNYEGSSSYESQDVDAPAGASFSGEKQLQELSCQGSHSLHYRGVELTPVPLSGLVRTLLGHREELDGVVRLKASLTGCELEEAQRQFSFTLREFGNLRWGGWRSVR